MTEHVDIQLSLDGGEPLTVRRTDPDVPSVVAGLRHLADSLEVRRWERQSFAAIVENLDLGDPE